MIRYSQIAKLWLATAAALFIAGLALADAIAGEPALKAPPEALSPQEAPKLPSPAQPARPEQEFYIVPARTMERVSEAVEAQRREIERLRALAEKAGCS
ncbi:MAG: hypothetical protein EPO20_24065 [Betaproteobacteria bacterium]|nr:MAG: hypothetical protein EPO20_24065 [Betaproteobacteria bacterium]